MYIYIYIYRYRKDKKNKPRNCVLLCVKSLKACIRRVIEKQLVLQTVEKDVLLLEKTWQPFLSLVYAILYYIDTYICSLEVVQNSILLGPFVLSTRRTIDPSD
jgi:hypothetical protein